MTKTNMNLINILNSKTLRVLAFSLFAVLALVGPAYAADPSFSAISGDLETLTLENRTTYTGTLNWRDPISANAGDAVSFRFYYHNTVEGTTANNVRLRIAYPTAASTSLTSTGTILSNNASQISDNATIAVSSSQTITFESTAYWYPNRTTSNPVNLTVIDNGSYAEVNIGDIVGGWPTQGNVVFRANISNSSPANNAPTVDAGSNREVNESQSVGLSASANDPDGDSMTYSWSCNGGSLSSSTILNPTFFAPSVSSDMTYSCILTATDNHSNSGSDSVSIIVRNTGIPTPGSPSVDAGSNRDIGESQSVVLAGSASDPQSDPMTYSWSCNGGSLSSSTILNPTFFAPSVSSDMTYSCILTATDNNSNSGSDSVSIIVRNTDGGSGSSYYYGGSGAPTLNVSLSASPATGLSPLNGVDLTASVSTQGISNQRLIIYRFDCENNNSWELRVETTNRNYTAQDLCNYQYDGTYTALVKVEADGYEATNQINIVVGTLPGGGAYGISVDAGPNKEIGEKQSTILNGYAYSQYGYSLGYYWSCNGGSLSNSSTLSPTYYAPAVNSDTTYSCTLFVTDGRGYKNSDTVNIIVREKGLAYSTGLNVTTNFAENVTGTSATLKGTLNNDGGQYASVRFNWGRLSNYNNFTSWVSGKTGGQVFSQYISGLEKGKAYHYRVEASNGKEIVVGQDITFVTKPDSTSGFIAIGSNPNQINLSWNPGASSCYTMITRKTGGYPTNSSDGSVVYYGTGSSYTDRNLSNNVWYYYRAWAVGCDEGLYSFADSQYAKAYTVSGVTGYVAPIIKQEAGIALEVLARDVTQNEIAWQNSIIVSPDDEIEFKVIITPTGGSSLEDVILKAKLSDKISSISSIKFDDESYNGTLDGEVKLGTIALGESKIVTFKGKIAGKSNFSYGSNELESSVAVSAKNVAEAEKTLNISVSRSVEAEAGFISFLDLRFYAGALTILFILVCLILMYLLIERKRGKECLTEKASATKVEKSRYFNIK